MVNFMGVPLTDIGPSFSSVRTSLAEAVTGGYKVAGVIERPVEALYFLEEISSQSRLNIVHNGYAARIAFLTNSLTVADKIILSGQVKKSSLRISRTGSEELINKLDIHYKRDNSRDGTTRFTAVAASSAAYPSGGDPGSIAAYGLRNPKRQYLFGFVDAPSVASDLRDFYITRSKDRKKRVMFTTFLDVFELEEGDVIELDYSFPGVDLRGVRFIVEKVSFSPGSIAKGRPDEMHFQALEIGNG
jgi:hypothetical protein